MDSVLELRALVKQYSTHRAVDGVSLLLARGEFFSLVGPSGCGKTTTLRMVAGFELPTSGQILLGGKEVSEIPPYRRDVSTVFQNYALFPHLTVAQNVAFGLARKGRFTKQEIRTKVEQALQMVQLSGKEQRSPAQISGGEKQRAALARSLVLEPQVLLLDEPLSALDPQLRKQIRQELKSLQRRVGITFLFITHDQEEALSLSDRLAVMSRGKLEQIGSPEELYRRPATRFVAEFLGDVNWIGNVAVRPESLRVEKNADGSPRSKRAVVQSMTFLGSACLMETRLENGSTCRVEVRSENCRFDTGETVYLSWQPADELPLAWDRV